MNPEPTHGNWRFSEDDVANIVRRAIAIDATRAAQADEVALREIAAEVGISGPAITQAIAEHRWRLAGGRVSTPPKPMRLSRLNSWSPALFSSLLGCVIGALARLSATSRVIGDVNERALATALAMGAASVAFAFLLRREDATRVFLIANTALWAGFVTGWSAVHGRLWGDLVFVGFAGVFVTSCAGLCSILWRERTRRSGARGGSSGLRAAS